MLSFAVDLIEKTIPFVHQVAQQHLTGLNKCDTVDLQNRELHISTQFNKINN